MNRHRAPRAASRRMCKPMLDCLIDAEKAELAGLITQYYDTAPSAKTSGVTQTSSYPWTHESKRSREAGKTVVDVYNGIISIINRGKIEPIDWKPHDLKSTDQAAPRLERFWVLATEMGDKSIWVLVDSIDKAANVQNSAQIFDCIAKLLLALRNMEFRQSRR